MDVIIDHHTHKANKEKKNIISIQNISINDEIPNSLFTIGLHPCDTHLLSDKYFKKIKEIAKKSNCVGIGECGLDYVHNDKKDLQKTFFIKHIELSEKIEKPLIVHLVRATNDFLEIRKQTSPKQIWMIHGFRVKPSVAQIMIDNGIYLSMGYKRNKQSLSLAFANNKLLLETDECPVNIVDIYKDVSADLDISIQDLINNISDSTPFSDFLFYKKEN